MQTFFQNICKLFLNFNKLVAITEGIGINFLGARDGKEGIYHLFHCKSGDVEVADFQLACHLALFPFGLQAYTNASVIETIELKDIRQHILAQFDAHLQDVIAIRNRVTVTLVEHTEIGREE